MRIEYTPEEVRTLLDEHETLEYASATDADVAAAADVLEGVEELVAKLDPAVRRDELVLSSFPAGEHFWIPVVRNCSRAAGVAVDPEGSLSFMVTGHEFGDDFPTYFSARQAVAHTLLRETDVETNSETLAAAGAPEDEPEGNPLARGLASLPGPATGAPDIPAAPDDEDAIVAALKANGNAIAAGRTVADVAPQVLAAVYPLSEAGVAHLFASEAEAGDGVVLALAGSTAGDRRRAAEKPATLSARTYSSRAHSVLFECGEAGSHYSEESWFGHSLTETPKPKEVELDDAAERFRAARFVRPSEERPLDEAAIRRRIGGQLLMRAAVRAACSVDVDDTSAFFHALLGTVLFARLLRHEIVARALDAESPWDSKAERGRMEKAGTRLRREIIAGRKARGGGPVPVTPAAELDAGRRARLAPPEEDPKLRDSIDRRRKSGRAAYDTARAVYLQRCPELEHKILHLLRRDGAGGTPEGEFVSRRRYLALDAGEARPEAAVRAALRALAEAGKVKRVRSQKTGQVFLAATEPLDETGHRRSLNALIRDERYGIVNPWAETAAAAAEGEDEEWQRGAEDLEVGEIARLAPRRLRGAGDAYERSLPHDDLLAEPAAQEEIDSVA